MNLALLRVCTIVFFVNILGFIISMLFMAVHSGELASLWNALTTSSFEDLLGTGGLMIASGVFIPLVLGTLAVAALFALGIFTLVKKNVKTLKILAVMFLAWVVLSAIVINHTNAGNDIVNLIFNVNVVVAIAAFFVAPRKRDEIGAVVDGKFNLGLFRLCAIFFTVSGLNSLAHFVFIQPPIFQLAFFGVFYLAVGVFALAKKNVPVLMVGSLMMFVKIFWSVMQIIHIDGWSFYMLSIMLIHSLLNVMTVISVAVFFIEPERTRCYLQKAKQKSL
ncbi:hypothetical protein [uncultured Fibrobacter sp.]|uniref:hypothetical protein n=1 Tax=uncultured Fibrobacter sp. TaxID=261512 RepID=UPI0025F68DBA|nr:hypothetical protein [uncultured Fibrobacter sp.]